MGTGTEDMIVPCREMGLPEPEFSLNGGFVVTLRRRPDRAIDSVTPQVAGEVRPLLVFKGEQTRRDLQTALGLKHEEHFRTAYLVPALEAGLIEMTVPDIPRSRLQRYRLTEKGKAEVRALRRKEGDA